MLVLSRKLYERVLIYSPNGELLGTVSVVDIDRGKVRIGFDLPRDHNIVRSEIDNTPARSTPDVPPQ